MPNAGQVHVDTIPVPKSTWLLKGALAAGVLICFAILPFRNGDAEGASPAATQLVAGIEASDSAVISDAANWRLSREADLDPSFIAWIDPYAARPHSRFSLSADGKNDSNDRAYLLTSDKTSNFKRVVWIANGRPVYDYVGKLIGIAKVPRDEMENLHWAEGGKPQILPDGDGLLVVREYGSPNGVSVFFLHAGVLYSGTPADYRSLSLD